MSFDWSEYLNLGKELAQATVPGNQEAKLLSLMHEIICGIKKEFQFRKQEMLTDILASSLSLVLIRCVEH